MAKLYYRYGTMGSSKTANALMTRFNYIEKGYAVLLMKPSIDNRNGSTTIQSRIGLKAEAITFSPEDDILSWFHQLGTKPDCIVVDECQFATAEQINAFKSIVELAQIPVFCYGLRTDFQSHLFDGSKRLFEIADSISELKSVCHCGKKAIINARYDKNGIVYKGRQIELGGNETYIGLCYWCWKNGNLG